MASSDSISPSRASSHSWRASPSSRFICSDVWGFCATPELPPPPLPPRASPSLNPFFFPSSLPSVSSSPKSSPKENASSASSRSVWSSDATSLSARLHRSSGPSPHPTKVCTASAESAPQRHAPAEKRENGCLTYGRNGVRHTGKRGRVGELRTKMRTIRTDEKQIRQT